MLFTVTATVTNTGGVVGDEVAQLYVALGGGTEAKAGDPDITKSSGS